MFLFSRGQVLVCLKRFVITGAMLGSLALSGCGPDFSSNHNQPSPVLAPSQNKDLRNKKEAPVTFEIMGLEPYRYQATFRWTQGLSNISVFINKQFAFKSDSALVTSYAVGLDHHRDYLVTVYSQKDQETKPTVVSEFNLQTPLDVVLTTDFIKAQPTNEKGELSIQANRVFLTSNGPENSIITEGRTIAINCEELISENGELMTFKEGQKAPMDQVGRIGGLISIKSTKATGKLHVSLRGENGGDGSNGPAFKDRAAKGKKGKDGTQERWEGPHPSTTCDQLPKNGDPGYPGSNGKPGLNGRAGGNSGILKIEIAKDSPDFNVQISKEPGVAGLPGKGGPGQLGGLGGDPGEKPVFCDKAEPGPLGPNGDPGPDGIREKNGLSQEECISIGEGFGRCS